MKKMQMKGAAEGVYRLGVSKEGPEGSFSGHVDGIQVNRAWFDSSSTLHVDLGNKTVTASPRTNDYGSYYIVSLGDNGFFVSTKETVKEKRPYLHFKKMAPRAETSAYGNKTA